MNGKITFINKKRSTKYYIEANFSNNSKMRTQSLNITFNNSNNPKTHRLAMTR